MIRPTSFGWVAIAVMSLLLMIQSSYFSTAQEDEKLLDPNEIGVEVLLNSRDVEIDPSPLVELAHDGYVNIPEWDPDNETSSKFIDLERGPFLFRSHYREELGVMMAPEDFTTLVKEQLDMDIDMKGWKITIAVPGTLVFTEPFNYFDMKFKPDVDLDLEILDWSSAMKAELQWLISIGVIKGLEENEIEDISSLSRLGTMGPDKRVFYFPYENEWTLFNEIIFTEIGLKEGPPQTYSLNEFPEDVAPTPHEEKHTVSIALIIIFASIIVSLFIGSFLYQRVNRAVKLNNARRKMIYERIHQNPGIHFSALMKDLDLKPGVASYHINRLEKMELIKSYQDGMYRRFYLFEDKVEMKIMLSDLQKLIVTTVQDEPGISQVNISRMIGKSKVVINYHVRFLRDLGILVLERDGRMTHCYLTPQGSRFASA
jgi:predicted transcriptional regulator